MKGIIRIGLIAMLLGLMACQPNNNRQMRRTGKTLSPKEFKEKLNWLFKDPVLYEQIEINKMGIALYRSAGAKDSGFVECRIYPDEYAQTAALFDIFSPDTLLAYYMRKGSGRWEQVFTSKDLPSPSPPQDPPSVEKPLAGWKIAVDPGHVSGDIVSAEVEGKYVKMKASPLTDGEDIGFFEPNLTLATAYLIRDSLEKLGAEILLSRAESGSGVRGKSFGLWLNEDWDSVRQQRAIEQGWDLETLNYWKQVAEGKDIFKRMFNAEDLSLRAKKINAFQPDLTLIIHYNIHSPNWDRRDEEGFFIPTEANYCMVFIPGSFAKGELGTAQDRLALLRMLLTDDVENSHDMATSFMKYSLDISQVPPVPVGFPLPYLTHYSILADEPGVYARNLALTRTVWGPLIYGESLCQDNIRETRALNLKDKEINGLPYPSRLDDIANVYIATVLDYVDSHQKSHPDEDGSLSLRN